jgi:outer membrane lipoprotein SlyB
VNYDEASVLNYKGSTPMRSSKLLFALLVGAALSLQGCAKTVAPSNYDATEVGKINKVASGTIVSAQVINIRNKQDSNGTDVPDNTGAPVRPHGYEYVIKLNSGAIISIAQTEGEALKPKQKVLVIYGGNTRVVPDEGSDDI